MRQKKTGFITKVYNIFIYSFAMFFFGYMALRMIFPVLKVKINPIKGIAALLLFVPCFLALWAFSRFFIDRAGPRTAKAALVSLILIHTALQIFCLNHLLVKPSWDFGAIMTAAKDIAAGCPVRNYGYFQEYPYNINPAVLIGTFQYLLGGNQLAPYVLNILCVTASVTGACLLAYRLYGQKAALLAAFSSFAVTPLYLDIPIVYTDTLSMPFAIWTVYCCTAFRSGRKRPLLWCVLAGLLSAMGFLIKQIAAIALIAFVIEYIMNREKVVRAPRQTENIVLRLFKGALPLAVTLLTFILCVSAFRFYVSYKGYDDRLNSSKNLPYTHWLMMGLNTLPAEGGTSFGYGGFSAEDIKYSRSLQTVAEKKEGELAVIKMRLDQFGPEGYLKFLLKKAEWTWTDGTYYVPVKLARYPVKRTILHKFIMFSNGKCNKLYLVFSQFVQLVILSMMLAGCISALRRGTDATFRLMVLMCLGLMVFLLFWETRSRYLIFIIPVFIVMTTKGMLVTFRCLDRVSASLWRKLKEALAHLSRKPNET